MEEKKKPRVHGGRDGIVQYPRLFFAALALALLVTDPFRLGPLAGIDYRPVKHELAPYREVMARWPRDDGSRLRLGRLEFVGEVFGPESIEFDRYGRGPYAGLADGRVVRWMGEKTGWETFAVMSPDWDHLNILLEGEGTGRLLRYDPETNAVHVVLHGLVFPNGVQISDDQRFLLFSETTNCRIMRYWLEGPRAGQVEVFADLPGFPDNVRLGSGGQFWVAIDCCRTAAQEVFAKRPWLRTLYFKLPLTMRTLGKMVSSRMHTLVALLDGEGNVVEVLEDRGGEVMQLVSEVREVGRKLWIGTVAHNHIATIPYPLDQEQRAWRGDS
ncbi:hypothetical protein ABZP36_005759 [Zizania latifolia]